MSKSKSELKSKVEPVQNTNCYCCNTLLTKVKTVEGGYGKFDNGKEMCINCFNKVIEYGQKSGRQKFSDEEVMNIVNSNIKPSNNKDFVNVKSYTGKVSLSKLENEQLNKRLAKEENILNTFRCIFCENEALIVLTEFRMIIIVAGLFSVKGTNIYYYNQIDRLKINTDSFTFKDLHSGYENEKEKIEIKNKTDFNYCVNLLKEQINNHKKYDKESYPYIISSYESGEIDKTELIHRLLDK